MTASEPGEKSPGVENLLLLLKNFGDETVYNKFVEAEKRIREIAPVFIRIDKFQESLRAFEKAREKIREIEKLLGNVQKLKEEEERELGEWESELQAIKSGIEKINEDIFSRIE